METAKLFLIKAVLSPDLEPPRAGLPYGSSGPSLKRTKIKAERPGDAPPTQKFRESHMNLKL